jgi:hypothetical protein
VHLLEESSFVTTPPLEPMAKPLPQESDKLFIFPTVKRLNTPSFNLSIAKTPFEAKSIKKITLFVKQRFSHLDDNSIDNEITLISAAVPINGVLTPREDIINIRVLGVANPQTSNDKLNYNEKQTFQNWLQYDITHLLKSEVTKRNKLISIDSESFDVNNSFITVEYNYSNVSKFTSLRLQFINIIYLLTIS